MIGTHEKNLRLVTFNHIHPSLVHAREMTIVVDNVYMVNHKNKL